QIDVPFPPDGLYNIVVHGYNTQGPNTAFTLFTWIVPESVSVDITIVNAPTSVGVNGVYTVDISWKDLIAKKKYLGAVSHSSDGGVLAVTLLNIDTN
ncbi:MAG: hypothetical protein ACXAC2_24290, partial [Candidatus Kariarchaeaceae archaeon]